MNQFRNRARWCLLFTLFVFNGGLVMAQAPASMKGTVTDPSGAAVPKASVTVSGPNQLVKVAQTGADGTYTLTALPAGAYTLRVTAPGFSLFEQANLELAAGRLVTADVKLAVASEKQEVTVTDQVHVELDPSKNAGALVLSGTDLDVLSDDPDDLQNDLMALAGPSAGPNGGQIFVDGFSNGQLPPKDSIREVRVNSNPFSAEFDKIGFGRIEILTKPGTDKLHGSLFAQTDTSGLDARNPYALNKPSFFTRQFQGNIGGAFNKKTSFFFDFSQRNQDDQALIKATFVDANLNPLAVNQNVPTPTSRTSFSPRIDYQLTPSITLQTRYTWTRNSLDNTGVGGFNLATQGINSETTTQSAQGTATWVLNASTINESRFQYTRTANSQQATDNVPTINVSGFFTGGAANQGPQYTNTNAYEFQNYTTYSHRTHFLKAGIRVRGTLENDFDDTDFNGQFSFRSLNAYIATLSALSLVPPGSAPNWPQIFANGGGAFQYTVVGGRPLSQVNQVDIAPFVQDDWHLIPSLTLSLGLRYEAQTNIHDKGNFAPRVGVAWGIGGGQGRLRQPKTVVRAGFGIFYDRFALAQVLAAERLNGIVQQKFVVQNPQFFTGDVPSLSELQQDAQPSNTYRIDPNLVAPRILQSAIGIDRQLPKNVTLSVNYTNSRGVHQLRTRDINAPLPGITPQQFPFGNANPLYQYESSGMFKQSQLTVNSNARLSSRYTMFGYYSYGHASSNTDGVNTLPVNSYDESTEWSRAAFDVRHRFLMGGNLATIYGIRLAPFMQFASAAPFNITVGQDLNGDSVVNDRPFLVPNSDCLNSTATGSAKTFYSTPYGCLSTVQTPDGKPISRNLGVGFGTFNLNLRISRTWGFGESTTRATPAGRGGGGGDGGRGPGGFGGGRGGPGGPGGPGGIFGGGAANRRYSLTLSLDARNLLNSVNPSQPVGTLVSPLFGQAQGLSGGFGSVSQSANRRLELQLRFTF